MAKRRVTLTSNTRRAVLTDMLPFEVPPTFSNRGFYGFIDRYQVEIRDGRVSWACDDDAIDPMMRLLFGAGKSIAIDTERLAQWNGTKTRRSMLLKHCAIHTIPMHFRVAHKEGARVLSVPHPRNQVQVASFYSSDGALILYYCSLSQFSMRKPVSIAKFAYFDDKLHQLTLDAPGGIEEEGSEYEQLGSYFVYRKFRNIHRFFESADYHRCEKKYDVLTQVDISKCFDSLYTHSIAWAILGRAQTKFHLKESETTFPGRFDSMMQALNYRETNGILIGPEFSRIFAELILQSIDCDLEAKLHSKGIVFMRDYEIFRYVDDYFVFCSDNRKLQTILDELQVVLRAKKLAINATKINTYERPIITELTIAKDRVASVLTEEIQPELEFTENSPEAPGRLLCSVRTDRLIVRYKTVVRESSVEYAAILNYTLAILENKLDAVLKTFLRSGQSSRDQERLVKAVLAMLEFGFFVFAASPKVNHSVRLCRMISVAVDFLRTHHIPFDLKHQIFRFVYDSIMEHLQKNAMNEFREVESLYLLVALVHIGKEYWLPEPILAKHFLIEEIAGRYSRKGHLGHFAITSLLSYMRDKQRYSKLRAFVISHAIEKIRAVQAHCENDAEALMLFLDLAACPYLSDAEKSQIANIFMLDAEDWRVVRGCSPQWFTAWGRHFSLTKELAAKRSREVY